MRIGQVILKNFLQCLYRLGLYRDAERQFKSALKQQDVIDVYLYLCKVYVRLDQPLTAIEIYKQGLEKFPNETTLLTGIARIYEVRLGITSAKVGALGRETMPRLNVVD